MYPDQQGCPVIQVDSMRHNLESFEELFYSLLLVTIITTNNWALVVIILEG